jgi:DNA replication protein DnaC
MSGALPPGATPSNNPGIIPNIPNPSLADVPKIRLVFLNTPPLDLNNLDGEDNSSTTESSNKDKPDKTHKPDKTDNKDKHDKKKNKKDKPDNKKETNKNDTSGYYTATQPPTGFLGANNPPRCNSSGCNPGDDPSMLFFQQILNRLHGIDKSSSSSKNSKNSKSNSYDGDETDTEDENANASLEFEWLGANIKTIDDLITLGKSYDSRKRKRYNLNLKQLSKLVAPLEELQAMVGMSDVKKIIFDQLIYYLQNLDDKNVDMLHTVIVGPPGVGKTQLTHIIAKIYNRLGFLKTDKVICAKRDDLIGEYIGQTAPKTRKVLERALGGVLLLDEIYSLAPTSDRDFAREAIDMINMYLSEHAHDLVCVVAGYKKPTYEKFFSQNEGLARRFTHHFEIKGYTPEELALIFKKYLEGQKWSLGASLEDVSQIIKSHIEIFPNFGGDMTTLFACCKKAHSLRLLAIPTEAELDATKKKIQKDDIVVAVGIFKEIKEKHTSADEEDKTKYMHMYV